jgi:hypothetical protein
MRRARPFHDSTITGSDAVPTTRKDTLTMNPRSTLAASILLVSAALGLAACATPTDPDASRPQPSQTFSNADDWFAAMADCMREHGVTVKADGTWTAEGAEEMAAADAATKECSDELPPVPGVSSPSAQDLTQDAQRTVECLREKGYEVPDIKAGETAVEAGPEVTTEDYMACLAGGEEAGK